MALFGSRDPHVVEELTTAQRLHLNMWTAFGVAFGALLGVRLAVSGWNPLIAVGGGMVLFPIALRLMMWGILSGAGGLMRQLYNPGGSHTPPRPAYSMPESLAARGRFDEAIAAYAAAADEEPDDPEPWLRIARIERMELRRPARAIEALRAARSRVAADSPTAMLVAREIADVWLQDPAHAPRAMPELARLAAGFAGTPTAAWASERLKELKARMAAGEFDVWVKGPYEAPPGPSTDEPDGSTTATSPAPG